MKVLLIGILYFFISCENQNSKTELQSDSSKSEGEQLIKKACACPKNDIAETQADTMFSFSNGKSISLCGYRNPESTPVTFSEFVLTVCGKDTIIGLWDATQTCHLRMNADTLFVENLGNLPVGKNRMFVLSVWSTTKIYFENKVVIKQNVVNRKLAAYTKAEIAQTLKEFETAGKGLNDEKIELANRLLIAAISGSDKARIYLKGFETKFGQLDGAYAEEFSDLPAMLNLWDQQVNSK